jgi:predicted dinucleotide-binding enzyme
MRIGILGSGMIGGTLGELWAAAGHEIAWSSRHPASLLPMVDRVGARTHAVTLEEAAAFGEVVLLAVPFGAIRGMHELGPFLTGKVLIDACNPFEQRDGADAHEALVSGHGSGEWTARSFPGARVVKAFNTVYFQTMKSPRRPDGSIVAVPIAGDDPGAVALVERLVRDAGMDPVRVGALGSAVRFDPGTAAWNSGVSAKELRVLLTAA